ncbi:hypothetical protein FXV83_39665 [Bradyrhizobium hipponense]|uniref:Uncharacterized protein n=1 Tax=Bradyrhizobium hipponense TaxID=2605638 RepID=A0A5S4YB14_9BRAD|nr:hypothetical protein [Bradyrhizobium hipponense]TYO61162.1 hypothetical protein FXV83_39665 [Bradyrhizobium hipponense]
MAAISEQQADVSETHMMELLSWITEAPDLRGLRKIECGANVGSSESGEIILGGVSLACMPPGFAFSDGSIASPARACLGGPASLGRTLGDRTNIEPFPRLLDQASLC